LGPTKKVLVSYVGNRKTEGPEVEGIKLGTGRGSVQVTWGVERGIKEWQM